MPKNTSSGAQEQGFTSEVDTERMRGATREKLQKFTQKTIFCQIESKSDLIFGSHPF